MNRSNFAATKVAGSTALVVLMMLTAAGCSKSSSSKGGGTPPVTPPTGTNVAPVIGSMVVTPSPVVSGQQFTVVGTVTDADGDSPTMSATVLSGTAPSSLSATLSGTNLTVTGVAGATTVAETVTVEVTADDGKAGGVTNRTFTVPVNPVSGGGGGGGNALSIDNISRYGHGATGVSASQATGSLTNAALRGSVPYVVSASHVDKYDVLQLKIVVNNTLRIQPTVTSNNALEFEMPLNSVVAPNSIDLIAYVDSQSTTVVETAQEPNGAITVNTVALGTSHHAYSGEQGAGDSGTYIAYDLDALGAFGNKRQLNVANGHSNKGGAVGVDGLSHFFAPATAATKLQLRRHDAAGVVASTFIEVAGLDNQEPMAVVVARNGDPVLLSVEPGNAANNFHVTRVKSDLSAHDVPVELSGANRLPQGTPLAGFRVFTWTQGSGGNEDDYAIIATGGSVNRLYVVNLDTRTFQVIDLGFSPQALSLIRDPGTAGWRVDLAGRQTGTGTVHKALLFKHKQPLPTPTVLQVVNAVDQELMGLVAFFDTQGDADPNNDRYVIWVAHQSETSIVSYDVNNAMATISTVALGNFRFPREMVRASGLNGLIVGYETAASGAKLITFNGGSTVTVEMAVGTYTNLAVGLNSFGIEKRSGGHDVKFFHVANGVSVLTTFLTRTADPTPQSEIKKFMRPTVGSQN